MRRIAALLALAAAGLAVPAGAAAAPAAPERIAVEAFGALPSFSHPRISADGKRILAIAYADGEKVIVVYDLDGGDGHFTRINVGDKLEVLDARWAGSRRVLLKVFGMNNEMGIEVPLSRLFLFDLDTKAMKPLGGAKIGGLWGGNLVHVDEAGDFILLEAQRTLWSAPSVLRIDLDTLKTKEVVQPYGGVWDWYADASGTVRAGLGSTEGKWFLLYREKEGGMFRRINGKRSHEDTLSDIEKVIPIPGSDKGYALAHKSSGRYGVYRYDFVADEIGEPVFEHPQVDVEAAEVSPRTGAIEAVRYTDDRDRISWFDPAMKSVQARLDKALPGRINRVVSRDAADSRMIVWSTTASDPGVYYLYDRARGDLREIARPHPALEGKPLAPVEPIRYAARDGLSIPAYLTTPLGRGEKGLPLIVMPHGGPFVRDSWEYDAWAQFLANRGYVVLQPNFRGSTGYGKEFVDAASGQYGRKMQDDLDDGVRTLVQRGLVDPKRVCIMGASYGGYAAMWAAARNPEIYRCAISFAGISEMKTMLHYDPGSWSARRYYRDWRDRIRGEDKFNLDEVSPLSRAAQIKVPLLIAHGEKDKTVPVIQSKKMDEALSRAGIAHEFVLYPEEKHGFAKAEDSIDFLKRVEAFLARYNPAS